jgi:hypothetical protein
LGKNCIMRSFITCTFAKYSKMIESSKMRLTGALERIRRWEMHIGYWWESQ